MFLLVVVFNGIECYCVNNIVILLIEIDFCGGLFKFMNRFEVYNISCFLVEFVEIY